MPAQKGYILVEGHGESLAAQNLVARLSAEVGLFTPWTPPRRWKNLHLWEATRGGIKGGAELIRTKPDAGMLLVLRDEDDDCPKPLAPEMADRLRELALPFSVAYVLLHPEYEVLFLPCLSRMVELGFADDTSWDGASWEARRGIKEWLSGQLPPGRSYKPTVDQLRMTQRIDFDMLRRAEVPCFGTLERALRFLHRGEAGRVYP